MEELESVNAVNLYIKGDPRNCPHLAEFSNKKIIPRIIKRDSIDVYTVHVEGLRLNALLSQSSLDELINIYSRLGSMIGYYSKCFVEHAHLHTDNIIIEEKTLNPYIIDWRYSRFTKFFKLDDVEYFLSESTKLKLDLSGLSKNYGLLFDACMKNFKKQQLIENEKIIRLRETAEKNYCQEKDLKAS